MGKQKRFYQKKANALCKKQIAIMLDSPFGFIVEALKVLKPDDRHAKLTLLSCQVAISIYWRDLNLLKSEEAELIGELEKILLNPQRKIRANEFYQIKLNLELMMQEANAEIINLEMLNDSMDDFMALKEVLKGP